MREDLYTETPPESRPGLVGETTGGPLQTAIHAWPDFVRQLGARPAIEQRRDLLSQRGTVDEHADFRILLERAWIEVQRADEDRRAIEHERLAVEARPRGAGEGLGGARTLRARPLRPQLEQPYALAEQGTAVLHVAGVYEPDVRRGPRVGQHCDGDTVPLAVAQEFHAFLTGHKIGR